MGNVFFFAVFIWKAFSNFFPCDDVAHRAPTKNYSQKPIPFVIVSNVLLLSPMENSQKILFSTWRSFCVQSLKISQKVPFDFFTTKIIFLLFASFKIFEFSHQNEQHCLFIIWFWFWRKNFNIFTTINVARFARKVALNETFGVVFSQCVLSLWRSLGFSSQVGVVICHLS